ncbi:MAG: MFS transporter [Candidatus Riflebacteria bacterium HGW-Riflebacteria-1]|jgi:OFA family oxalate/formate antiporter-like MFS transporter|nr:MAG: MFS transporter [Candidatus Riflebacteria bacterium HGW-Riflebacteria-1]
MWNVKNKYIVLVGALLAQVTIAGLYAWSVFGVALQNERGWGSNEAILPYSLAQFIFALSTLASGPLVDRKGPRIALVAGAVLYGGGLILSSFATTPEMLYLSYGLLCGAGVGFVYVCPLATLIKWFPTHRGFITGLSVSVFGGGSIIFRNVISSYLTTTDVSGSMLKLGLVSFALILTGAMLTNNPPDYIKKAAEKGERDFTTGEMMKTSKFRILWIMYWLAVIPGLLVLGAAKNIGLEVAGLDIAAASGIIAILAICNALSRLISGALSDKLGTLNVLKGSFIITIVSLFALSFLADYKAIFYLAVSGVAIGYGGFLALFPTFTNQEFGSFRYASNYGLVYQAYGLAALSGIFLKSMTGSFTNTFIFSALAASVGFGLSFMIKERNADQRI